MNLNLENKQNHRNNGNTKFIKSLFQEKENIMMKLKSKICNQKFQNKKPIS